MTSVRFESKPPHTTCWIKVAHAVGEEPSVVGALREIGWRTDADRGMNELPPLDGEQEVTLTKTGSGLFGGWSDEEAEAFESEALKVMGEHGFDDVPFYELSLADLL